MGDGNGNVTRPSFGQRLQGLAGVAGQGVPIVGLPFVLEAWFVQILLTCKCDQPKPVLILGQPGTAVGQCPSCLKQYLLQAIGIHPVTGQPHFQVAMITADPSASAEDATVD